MMDKFPLSRREVQGLQEYVTVYTKESRSQGKQLNNIWHLYVGMNREYSCKVSSKSSKRLLKKLQNTTGDYFFAAPCRQETQLLLRADRTAL